MSARVSIVGVSGYSGMELARLVEQSPGILLTGAVSDRWKQTRLGEHVPLVGRSRDVMVAPMADALAVASDADIALLATPAEVSAEIAPKLLEKGTRVVDLSGAFRLLQRDAYPRWYGFTHPCPELLAEARYGLPEIPVTAGDAPAYAKARLVANPGCYATASILALAPLVAGGLIGRGASIFIDGKSGVTGAGRKVEERYMFTEVAESVTPYRVGNHQHTPEIEQALARIGAAHGSSPRVSFVPHLLPVRRGLMITAMAPLAPDADPAVVDVAADQFFAQSPLVKSLRPEAVSLARAAYTNDALVAVRADPRTGAAIAMGALDNLLKGAASQAIQNVCAMLGLPFAPRPS